MKRTQWLSLGACAGLAIFVYACGTEGYVLGVSQHPMLGVDEQAFSAVLDSGSGDPNQFPNDPNFQPPANNTDAGEADDPNASCDPNDHAHHGHHDPNHGPNGTHDPRAPNDPNRLAHDHEGNAGDPNGATCDSIHERLHHGRKALAETVEWTALTETPEWAAVKEDVQKAHQAHCKINTPQPSNECQDIIKQIHQDSSALRATQAYQTAEATPQWQALKQAYADTKAHGCRLGHHHHSAP